MASFKIGKITFGYFGLTLLVLGGCGFNEATGPADQVDQSAPLTTPASPSSANQELQATFDKVSPTLLRVRDARNSLLRNGAFFSEDPNILRSSAVSYRESLLLLRRKFLDLEMAVGTDATKRLVDFIIANGFIMAPEIMTDMEPGSPTRSMPHHSET